MKEVKIEYNKILPTFYCGLTAFSNLLQLTAPVASTLNGCGLTAFSNLLQPRKEYPPVEQSCGLTAFSNLLQPMST